MNQQTQGMSSLSSPDPTTKRKRGRPRKDDTLVHGEGMNALPGSGSLKKTKQEVGASDDVENEMVGQVVTGVIEGSFDAGYLLNVRVADTDTQLRGVVFLAEKVAPITPANDIAPHIKMCKRKDLPIPTVNQQSQVYGSARPPEQSYRQPVEVKSNIPKVPAQTQSCVPQSGIAESFDKKSFSVFMPPNQTPAVPVQTQSSVPLCGFQKSLLENKSFTGLIPPVAKLPTNDAGSSLPHNVLEPGIDSQTPPEGNSIVGQDKVLEEVKAATIVEGSNGVGAIKVSETETAFEPIADISCIRTTCKDLETQQDMGSEKCALVQGELKGLELQLSQTPVVTENADIAVIPGIDTVGKDPEVQAQAGDPENSRLVHKDAKSLDFLLNQTSGFAKPAPVDVVESPSIELNQKPVFAEPACVSSDLASKPVDSVMEEQADSAPNPGNNVMEEQAYSAQKPVDDAMEEQAYSAQKPVEDAMEEQACSAPKPIDNATEEQAYSALKPVDNAMEEQAYSAPKPVNNATEEQAYSLPEPVANVMEEQAYSAPKPSQMFGREIVPSDSKLEVAAEGPILPGMVEPQITSSGTISRMDCDVEDVIPPAQS